MSNIEVQSPEQSRAEHIDVHLGEVALSDYHGEGGTRNQQPQGLEGEYPRTDADSVAEQKSEEAWARLGEGLET